MNKRISTILNTLLAILLLTACNNQFDSVFSESADERVKKAMEEYRSAILGASNGWKAYLVTGTGAGYMFYFDFKQDGTVTMVSDYNDSTAQFVATGTYLMKALQRITLSFDTYSYIHLLADPDGSVNGGVDGDGLISDFEFAFVNASENIIELVGIQRDTPMNMIPATALEKTRFLSGDLKTSRQHAANLFGNTSMHYYIENQTGGKEPLGINEGVKNFNIFYLDTQNKIQKTKSIYTYSLDGIQLNDYISTKDYTFNQLLWDAIESTYYILINGQKVFIEDSSTWIEFSTADPTPRVELTQNSKSIIINPQLISDLSTTFMAAYDQTDLNLTNSFGLNLGNVTIQFVNSNSTLLGFDYVEQSTSVFFGYHVYSSNITSGDVLSFGALADKNTSTGSDAALSPLIDYFINDSFKLAYVPDANLGQLLIKLTSEATPTDYIFGILPEQ